MTALRSLAPLMVTLLTLGSTSVFSEELPTLKVTSSTGSVTFDRDELEEMGLVSIKTKTPWNEGVVDFEGVPFTVILEKANATGETAVVTALNDYSVDIPVSDFAEFGTILAVKRNGEYMPVDDQGPFFVVYPYDSDPKLRAQPYHGRSVWQVREITVE